MPTDDKGPRLSAPAQVGGTRFGVNIPWRTVIEAAQRHYTYMMQPEREEARIKAAGEFVEKLRAATYAPPATPQESDAQELRATRDMLESARRELEMIREALGVTYEPHQNLFMRTMAAARGVSAHVESVKANFTPLYLMANARRICSGKHQRSANWVLAMELFAVGSNTARRICQEAGVDPDGLEVRPSEARNPGNDQ